MVAMALSFLAGAGVAFSAPLDGGTLDPLSIPKYVTPLVIPPVMPETTVPAGAPAADYDIAVRQFKQQILPGGIWKALDPSIPVDLPATPIWSYGRAQDPAPDITGVLPGLEPGVAPAPNSSFNYPAFTFETLSQLGAATPTPTTVRWMNDLVVNPAACRANPVASNPACAPLPHLLGNVTDQTLHWANPVKATLCANGQPGVDCRTNDPSPYLGAVPIVTHVHGAHVNPESDGYPEAWWLPVAADPTTYSLNGTIYTQFDPTNNVPGSALYGYENDQPATTLWYHDHTLGMTRLNVYAGPAGFWLVRGGDNDLVAGLPGPAPVAGEEVVPLNTNTAVRNKIREIPIVIQDRSFNDDGSLFYPDNRAFFEGLATGDLQIPFIPDSGSDISAIWNPEAFFNTMVVNGVTWPQLEVAKARYRFRLLDGCNSRFLNLSLKIVQVANPADASLVGTEIPFYQIGAEQGFLPKVVRIKTGEATPLPSNDPVAAADPDQALLMGPAERADVIVDFSELPNGTIVRMINTGPDEPFGGFTNDPGMPNDEPAADPDTTGQVMQFVVNDALTGAAGSSDGKTADPASLVLPNEGSLGTAVNAPAPRALSLNEEGSLTVCAKFIFDGPADLETSTLVRIEQILGIPVGPGFEQACLDAQPADPNVAVEPMGPKAALLGTFDTASGAPTPKLWVDDITESPILGDTEEWEIYNLTADAHPIHLHLVRFEVLGRRPLDILPDGSAVKTGTERAQEPTEKGYKDTVIAYPGEVTRLKAKFDKAGLYVWHCHIVEHEDNEMMRPYTVRYDPDNPDLNGDGCVDRTDYFILAGVVRSGEASLVSNLKYDLNGDGLVNVSDARFLVTKFTNPRGAPCN